jgi:hypothetical protein
MSLQVTAGKLKLKGGLSLGGKKKKSKKKKKKRKKDPEEENSTTATTSTTKRAKIKDTRTAAEKNMDERLRIRVRVTIVLPKRMDPMFFNMLCCLSCCCTVTTDHLLSPAPVIIYSYAHHRRNKN